MTESLSIIHTIATLGAERGGPSRTVLDLSHALAMQGLTIRVVVGDAATPPTRAQTVDPPNFRTHSVTEAPGFAGLFRQRAVSRLLARVRSEQSDAPTIIHDHGMWLPNNHTVARVAERLATPRIVSPRGMISRWSLNHHRYRKRLAWWLYQGRDLKSADVIHTTSQLERDEARALGLRQPVAVIPNGVVDLPNLPPAAQQRDADRTVLFLSRLHPKKGILNLIKAWAALHPVGWRLVIAGPDDAGHRAEVEAMVRATGVGGSTVFVGDVRDDAKWSMYRAADLFVLPTFSENFGIVVAEALACAVPVITTKAAPWSGLVTNQCGWWIDVGVEPLTLALSEAMRLSDAEREAMGHRGRVYVTREFGWDRIAREMAAVYRWMLGRQSAPACVDLG